MLPVDDQSYLNIQQLRFLSNAAVAFRYPGESADKTDAGESLQICNELRQVLHKQLK